MLRITFVTLLFFIFFAIVFVLVLASSLGNLLR
jgi:hypothetical protein